MLITSISVTASPTHTIPNKPLPFTITEKNNTILPTEVVLGRTVHAIYTVTNHNKIAAKGASIVSLPPNTSIERTGCYTNNTFSLAPNESCTLTLIISSKGLSPGHIISAAKNPNVLMLCWNDGISCAGVSTPKDILHITVLAAPNAVYQSLMQDTLINADLWGGDTPQILSATAGFTNISGVPGNEAAVIAAGGAWQILTTPNPPYNALTSSVTPETMAETYGYPFTYADTIPVCFNWPVLPSSVLASDFRVTLSNGVTVQPKGASIAPNLLYNKRNCVTLVGKFGNRLPATNPNALHPTKVTVVDNGTTLMLVGPNGLASAVGLFHKDIIDSYNSPRAGPKLIGAKLSVMSELGQDAPIAFTENLPNGGTALYGYDAQYRLRLLTSQGTSINGVSSIQPIWFNHFFRIQVISQGKTFWLTETNRFYIFPEGIIEIIGLADLGRAGEPLNDAYVDDNDGCIDIILKGEEAAMKLITAVEVPATAPYLPFYDPGGPGNNPTPGVRYTSPGPPSIQSVTIALDDPMTVNYPLS